VRSRCSSGLTVSNAAIIRRRSAYWPKTEETITLFNNFNSSHGLNQWAIRGYLE
jgi:hypothetical protein